MLPRIIPQPAKALTPTRAVFSRTRPPAIATRAPVVATPALAGALGPWAVLRHHGKCQRRSPRKSLKQDEKHPSTLTPCHGKVRRGITEVQYDTSGSSEQDRKHAQDRRSRFTRENDHRARGPRTEVPTSADNMTPWTQTRGNREHFQGRMMFQPPDMKNWAYRRPAGSVINKVRNCPRPRTEWPHQRRATATHAAPPECGQCQMAVSPQTLTENDQITNRCVRLFFLFLFSLCFVGR